MRRWSWSVSGRNRRVGIRTTEWSGCHPAGGPEPFVHFPGKGGDDLGRFGKGAAITGLDDPGIEGRPHPSQGVLMEGIG